MWQFLLLARQEAEQRDDCGDRLYVQPLHHPSKPQARLAE